MKSSSDAQSRVLDSQSQRASRRYAAAQTSVLIAFALVDFLSPKDYLFTSFTAGLVGYLLCAIELKAPQRHRRAG